ncbi:UNVERIFIED_CONTAM: hypothetical protein RMT77_012763 [Armadillidium vulgare]
MNIKCESEIKIEELDLEYDSYQQDSQIFSDNESDFTLKTEDIEIEELDEKISIKSELTESEKESVLDEGLVNNGVIKSENAMMIEEKSCGQHSKTLMINVAEGEEDLEVKSTSKSKPQRADVHQQNIEKYHVENLRCRYCIFSFKSKDELKTHLKTHNKRKFKCAHCSYESNFKSGLKYHMLTHSSIKLYKCSHCSYECNQKGSLKLHMLTHTNEKLFKCSDCSYECNDKRSLKRHMLTHTNIKLFKCSYCSYESNKNHLKTHTLTHTNVKLFKCSHCSYESNHKKHLKTHILTHTHTRKIIQMFSLFL